MPLKEINSNITETLYFPTATETKSPNLKTYSVKPTKTRRKRKLKIKEDKTQSSTEKCESWLNLFDEQDSDKNETIGKKPERLTTDEEVDKIIEKHKLKVRNS